MPLEFQWEKLRPEPAVRALLGSAVDEFNQSFGEKFHIIRHPFGKIIACRVNNLWFFHASGGGRPPQLATLAVVEGSEPKSLFPDQRPADFEECCILLGLVGEAEKTRFEQFVFPKPGRASRPTMQGAS